jgi:hypothetical protein
MIIWVLSGQNDQLAKIWQNLKDLILFAPSPAETNVIYGQFFRENCDEFCDAQKLHECTFMPFQL